MSGSLGLQPVARRLGPIPKWNRTSEQIWTMPFRHLPCLTIPLYDDPCGLPQVDFQLFGRELAPACLPNWRIDSRCHLKEACSRHSSRPRSEERVLHSSFCFWPSPHLLREEVALPAQTTSIHRVPKSPFPALELPVVTTLPPTDRILTTGYRRPLLGHTPPECRHAQAIALLSLQPVAQTTVLVSGLSFVAATPGISEIAALLPIPEGLGISAMAVLGEL